MSLEKKAEMKKAFLVLGLSLVYFGAAKWGLSLAFVQANATAIWPPTGIALAALLLGGWKLWPGVFLGAFAANLWTAGNIPTSLGIAAGNTLEALLGFYLVSRFARGPDFFRRSTDLFKFAILGGLVAPLVSATVGVLTLTLAGMRGGASFRDIWWTWWLGDMGGALLVAPPILLWPKRLSRKWETWSVLEGIALAAIFGLTAWVLFGGWSFLSVENYPVQFLFIPLLLWAAVRFGPFAAALSLFFLTFATLEGTLHGWGPFHGVTENQSLLFLQGFMSVTAITVLALAAGVEESRRAEEKLRWSHSDLQLRVLERTEDLQAANLRLETEVAEKESLAQNLRESNERFRLLSEATQEGVVLMERGKIHDANRTFCSIFGYELWEVLGKKAEDFVAPEFRESVSEHILSKNEETYSVTGLRKDGARIDLEVTGKTFRLDGETARVTAVRDVTEKNRREEELRRLALIVETSQDFICVTGIEGRMIYLNKAGREMTGLSSFEDISLKKHSDFVDSQDVPRLMDEVIASLLSKGHWSGEFQLKNFKTAEPLPLHFTAVLIRDPATGQPTALAGIGRDTRELKKKEEELRRMALIVENSQDMILLSAPEGGILYFNQGGRRMLGIGEGEDVGTLDPGDFTHSEDMERARKEILPRLLKEGRWEGEFRFRNRQSGEALDLHFLSVVIQDPKTGKPNLVASIGRDVTERKKIDELARSNRELEQFAYVASHDLQEPLRMVGSFVQLLALRYKGRLDEEADQYIHETVEGVSRMRALILDLLAYSRVGSANEPFEKVDCAEALRQALLNLERALKESGAKVSAGDLPSIKGDFNQIVQLFQNLVANAVKFKGESPPEIFVEAKEKNGEWLFFVRDNGIGLEQQYAEKIFEIFKRLHTRSEYPGTGIGLAICKKVVTRHGGKIWVESQLGKGASFYWTMPLLKASKE